MRNKVTDVVNAIFFHSGSKRERSVRKRIIYTFMSGYFLTYTIALKWMFRFIHKTDKCFQSLKCLKTFHY